MFRFVLLAILTSISAATAAHAATDPSIAVIEASAAQAPAARVTSRAGGAVTAPAVPAASAMVVDITLERQRKDGKIETMAAGHVFAAGDIIRLKLMSHYDGFLYVMDQGSSGHFMTVFPSVQTGSDNRVHMAKQYLVPAVDEGWFTVEGPAGFDVLYFLLSPSALASPSMQSFVAPGPVSSLKPRCNDAIFRARGDCTDDSAGPAALPAGEALPAPLAPIAGSASRDITFTNKTNGTVGVTGESAAPMLYTFRLAHL